LFVVVRVAVHSPFSRLFPYTTLFRSRFGFPLLPGSGRKADGEVGVVTNDQITGGVRCCKRRTTENKHSFGSNNGSEVVYPPRKIGLDREHVRTVSSAHLLCRLKTHMPVSPT